MWRVWCFLLIALALALRAASVSPQERTVVELGDRVLVNGAYVFEATEQRQSWSLAGAVSSFAKQVADGATRAFWAAARFCDSIVRHEQELFTRAAEVLTGKSSMRLRLFKGNAGATEPLGVMPAPPIRHYRRNMRSALFAAVNVVLEQYHNTALKVPAGTSCLDALDIHLSVLKKMLGAQLHTTMCKRTASRLSGCSRKFCDVLERDEDAALNMVFSILDVKPLAVAFRRLDGSPYCPSINGEWRNSIIQARHLGRQLRHDGIREFTVEGRMDRANKLLNKLCVSPACSRLRDACQLRKAHPAIFDTVVTSDWFKNSVHVPSSAAVVESFSSPHYRRAMLFRGMVRGQAPVEVRIFGGAQELYFEPLKLLMIKHMDQQKQQAMAFGLLRSTLNQAVQAVQAVQAEDQNQAESSTMDITLKDRRMFNKLPLAAA